MSSNSKTIFLKKGEVGQKGDKGNKGEYGPPGPTVSQIYLKYGIHYSLSVVHIN